jgi:thiamine biosynthesis lipoprotein
MHTLSSRYLSFISLVFITTSCQNDNKTGTLTGSALGTSYTIKHDSPISNDILTFDINKILEKINQSMSTYDSDSDISKINNGYQISVDPYFKEVYLKSLEVWTKTKGAFDPTVGSLVNAYGFGPNKNDISSSLDIKIDSLLELTGFDKIKLNEAGVLVKSNKNIILDFNAIAKGYSVDIISKYIEKQGAKNYLVEIGGEIMAKGLSPRNKQPWKIGISYPSSNSPNTKNYTTYLLSDKAIATSGNYRHFKVDNLTGKRIFHTIDPRTGKSVQSKILSTSVVALDCASADAWATGLMVLDLEEGLELIEKNSDLEALWIIENDNALNSVYSSGWEN